jgi:hypothetical protein
MDYVFHLDFILLGKNCENDIDDCVGICMDDNAVGVVNTQVQLIDSCNY